MPRAGDQPAHVRTVDEQVVVGADLRDGVVAPVGQQAVPAAGQVEPEVVAERVQVDRRVPEDVDLGAFGREHLGDHPVVAFPAAHGMPEPVVDGGPYTPGRLGYLPWAPRFLRAFRLAASLPRGVGRALRGGLGGDRLRCGWLCGDRLCRGRLCRRPGHRCTSQFSSSRWRVDAVREIIRRRVSMAGSSRR